MNTLVDFVTHTKGIEYLLAISFIMGYGLLFEFLKPRPFASIFSTVKDDVSYMGGNGRGDMKKLLANMLKLPFVAGAYLMALPFYLMVGLMLQAESALARLVGAEAMAWRPLESYLTGRGRKKGKRVSANKEKKERA